MSRSRAAVAAIALLSGVVAGCAAELPLGEQLDDRATSAVVVDDGRTRSDVVDDARTGPPRPPVLAPPDGTKTSPAQAEVDCASATYAIATGTGLGRCTVVTSHDRVIAGWCGDSNSNVSAVDCMRGCASSLGKGTCEQKQAAASPE